MHKNAQKRPIVPDARAEHNPSPQRRRATRARTLPKYQRAPAKFRIGLVQMACSLDPHENLAKAEWRIREAAARGAHIVCLQELFRSQYFCREENAGLFDLAGSIPGPSTAALSRLAAELGVVVVGSLFERRTAGVYHNTAAIIDAQALLHCGV
jgi:N-carbamoylputrescine amidase